MKRNGKHVPRGGQDWGCLKESIVAVEGGGFGLVSQSIDRFVDGSL